MIFEAFDPGTLKSDIVTVIFKSKPTQGQIFSLWGSIFGHFRARNAFLTGPQTSQIFKSIQKQKCLPRTEPRTDYPANLWHKSCRKQVSDPNFPERVPTYDQQRSFGAPHEAYAEAYMGISDTPHMFGVLARGSPHDTYASQIPLICLGPWREDNATGFKQVAAPLERQRTKIRVLSC